MQTRCPECNTLFKLNEHDLSAAEGQVQCGHCFAIFQAKSQQETFELVEEVDTSDIDINTFTDAIDEIPEEQPLTDNFDNQIEHTPLFDKNPMIDDLVPPELRHQQNTQPNKLLTTLMSLVLIIITLTAATQLIYFNRNTLASKPEIRPYMLGFCELANCEIADLRDLKRLELTSKNVYSHPNVDNALMITAVIVNQAAFAQQFPVLQISFTNLVGDIVRARQFKPGEYLNTSEETLSEMQPGLPIQISLEVLDPGKNATAYEFNFI